MRAGGENGVPVAQRAGVVDGRHAEVERGTARVLGCQVLGEGATDLVHLGQAAIAMGATADFFVEQIFNFPTMTEAYRIAAFDVLKQRSVPQATHLKLAHAAG